LIGDAIASARVIPVHQVGAPPTNGRCGEAEEGAVSISFSVPEQMLA